MQRLFPYVLIGLVAFVLVQQVNRLRDANATLRTTIATQKEDIRQIEATVDHLIKAQQFNEDALTALSASTVRKNENLQSALKKMDKDVAAAKVNKANIPTAGLATEISSIQLRQVWDRYCEEKALAAGCQ